MPYVIVGLCLVIALLLLVCRYLWRASRSNDSLFDWIGQLETDLRAQQAVSTDFRYVLARIGELLDGAGETLHGSFSAEAVPQEAVDLVGLGAVLRRLAMRFPADALSDDQHRLAEIGDRYGIEPDLHGEGGCRFSAGAMVRIGEEIFGRVLIREDLVGIRSGH